MERHRKIRKVNLPMAIASVLFCLTLFSIYLTSGLYARYTSTGIGKDTARVITFGDLTFTEESNDFVIPGVDLQRKMVVEFDGSEAATYLFVEIIPEGWTTQDKQTFEVELASGTVAMQWSVEQDWKFLQLDKGRYVYYQELAPNTKVTQADVIAKDGTITVSDKITRSEIETLTGISIKLRASVVQAGGFANAESAYQSIAAKEGR